MLDGLRGEDSISELCRKEGIAQNLYYRWSKEFLEAGKSGFLATPHARRAPMRSRHLQAAKRSPSEGVSAESAPSRPSEHAACVRKNTLNVFRA